MRRSTAGFVCVVVWLGACGGKSVRPEESPKPTVGQAPPASDEAALQGEATADTTPAPAAQPSTETSAAPSTEPPPQPEPAAVAEPAKPVPTDESNAPATTPQAAAPAATSEQPPATAPAKESVTPPAAPAPRAAKSPEKADKPAPVGGASSSGLEVPAGWTADAKVQRTWKAKCGACHGADGRAQTQQGKKMGMADLTAGATWKGKTMAGVRKSLAEGISRNVDGKQQEMKPVKNLTSEEIDALLYYALSFRK